MGAKLLLMDFGVGSFGLKTAPFASKGMPLVPISLGSVPGRRRFKGFRHFAGFYSKTGL
jgi:hypothetical protein